MFSIYPETRVYSSKNDSLNFIYGCWTTRLFEVNVLLYSLDFLIQIKVTDIFIFTLDTNWFTWILVIMLFRHSTIIKFQIVLLIFRDYLLGIQLRHPTIGFSNWMTSISNHLLVPFLNFLYFVWVSIKYVLILLARLLIRD